MSKKMFSLSPMERLINKKGVGTVFALSLDQVFALPLAWIKQQQPTPIGYMIPITGKYISNDAGAIAIIFMLKIKVAKFNLRR